MSYPGHEVLTETLSVPYDPEQYSAMKHDFKLQRVASATISDQAEPTLSCNYSLLPQGGGAAAGSAWSGLTVGFSLVTVLQSLMDWITLNQTAKPDQNQTRSEVNEGWLYCCWFMCRVKEDELPSENKALATSKARKNRTNFNKSKKWWLDSIYLFQYGRRLVPKKKKEFRFCFIRIL